MADSLDENLDEISEEGIPDAPSDLSRSAEKDFDKLEREYDHKHRKAYLKQYKQNISERKKYARSIYVMLAWWLLFAGSILLLSSMHKIAVSDNVLIVLLTTSSANVIAIFIYVVKYLFAKD